MTAIRPSRTVEVLFSVTVLGTALILSWLAFFPLSPYRDVIGSLWYLIGITGPAVLILGIPTYYLGLRPGRLYRVFIEIASVLTGFNAVVLLVNLLGLLAAKKIVMPEFVSGLLAVGAILYVAWRLWGGARTTEPAGY